MDDSSDESTDTATPPSVAATRNGPYRVRGIRRIVWREKVQTARGEPITWRQREVVADADQEYWLCRCGQSANKPFCDSSHRRVGFAAEDAADPGARADRAKAYGSDEIGIDDDRGLCSHAGFCANKITNAWKLAARQDLDAAGETQLVSMAHHCPSGALTARAGGTAIEPALPAEVALVPDGPLWVTGDVIITRSDGVALERRNRVTLCRCGASSNKPLCDGSHADVGFEHSP